MIDAVSPNRRRFDEEQLLDAARHVFSADGYSAAQIADIAVRAGTTRPTLHSRLGAKEDIYLRVVQREADVFEMAISDAYARGVDLSLAELARVGMEPMFRFASDRPEGFGLLFRGDNTGERPASLRREVIHGVTSRLTQLIERRQMAVGPPLGPIAETLAAACVGVALQVCEDAIEHRRSLDDALSLAAGFVEGAFRHLHLSALAAEAPKNRA